MAAESTRCDLHVHLASRAGLADAAAAGVSFLRDAGTREGAGLALAGSRAPRVLSAGRALHPAGGYGGRFGVPVRVREDIRREILSLRQAGAGIIKVMASGIVSLRAPETVTAGGFSSDDMKFIIEESKGHNLGVMAHANGAVAISAVCETGAISVEHGFFMNDEALECLKRNKVLWVPTVGALKRAAEASEHPGAKKIADEMIDAHLRMIGKAFRLGVPLGIGTDCTLPDPKYKEAYEAELEWFVKAGMPRVEVERIAREGGKELPGFF